MKRKFEHDEEKCIICTQRKKDDTELTSSSKGAKDADIHRGGRKSDARGSRDNRAKEGVVGVQIPSPSISSAPAKPEYQRGYEQGKFDAEMHAARKPSADNLSRLMDECDRLGTELSDYQTRVETEWNWDNKEMLYEAEIMIRRAKQNNAIYASGKTRREAVENLLKKLREVKR